jgi:hypothetical protein
MFWMKYLDGLAYFFLLIGAINWGLWGLFQVDVVAMVFGGNTALISRVVYTLMGLAAIYEVAGWKAIKHRWCMSPATA